MKKRLAACLLLLLCLTFALNAHAAKALTFATSYNDASSEALARFQKETGVAVKTQNAEERKADMIRLLTSRDRSVDVYSLRSDNNTLKTLAEKGYCVDLSDVPEISAFVSQLLPEVADTVTLDGHIVAVPTAIRFPYLFTYHPALLEECGMTEANLPATLTELFDFIDRWYEEKADAYPHIVPFYAFGLSYEHRNPYLKLVLEMYRDGVIAQTGALTYDTPLFRQLMRHIARYDQAESGAANIMYDTPQLSNTLIYCRAANMWTLFANGEQVMMPPPALAEDIPARQPFFLQCSFVNPYSASIDLGRKLLACYADCPDPSLLCATSPALAAPVEKPTFARDYQDWIDIRDRAERKLASDSLSDSERKDCERSFQWASALLADPEAHRYDISPADLAAYQSAILPVLFSRGLTLYDFDALNQQLDMLFDRYADHALSLDALIPELDHIVQMAVLEEGA